MRLRKARVTKYRSVRDSGWFDVAADDAPLLEELVEAGEVLFEAL